MTDTTAEIGPGAVALLATYAIARLRWADVEGQAETTFGRVEKDAQLERGKRMCATGELLRIESRTFEGRTIYVGRLRTDESDLAVFVAVGTTGELIKRSRATLCGVVIGRSDDAVSIVGMFDLPENRSSQVER